MPQIRSLLLLLGLILVFGCSDAASEQPAAISTGPLFTGPLRAVIDTDRGICVIELAERDAPKLSANFANLVKRRFFDGLAFYRSSTVMRQAGNPFNTETQHYDPGYRLLPEFSPNLNFNEGGVLAMPLLFDGNMSDIRQTEFFITVKPQDRWTFKYPIFGRLVEGREVVQKLQDGDLIRSIRLEGDPAPLMEAHAELLSRWNQALDANPVDGAP